MLPDKPLCAVFLAALTLSACSQAAAPTATTKPASSPSPKAAAVASPTPAEAPVVDEKFSMSAKAASVDASLSINGPLVTVNVTTNFPSFKSGYYVAEIIVTTPESAAIHLPKCAGHERACRLDSNAITDIIDCDGICHPGTYTVVASVFSHNDGTRMAQSPSYIAWVGGESGKNLAGHPLAVVDPMYAGSTYLRKEVNFQRLSY
jgi:hypothetical protein